MHTCDGLILDVEKKKKKKKKLEIEYLLACRSNVNQT